MKPSRPASARPWIAVLLPAALSLTTLACGPFFPNRILDDGELLTAPLVDFRDEIRRVGELRADWSARPGGDGPERQSAAIEIADLREALRRNGVPAAQATNLVARHAAERAKAVALYATRDEPAWLLPPKANSTTNDLPAKPEVVAGLPDEFAEYFRGWLAWKSGQTNAAIAAWEAVLALPEGERRFKSVWAAYMLGRVKVETKPLAAVNDLQLARLFVGQGFPDRLGLAAASLGWEARALLNARLYPEAIEKYLAQLGTGDESALVSLRWAAAAALKEGGGPLLAVAGNPRTRNVVTAYLLSSRNRTWQDGVLQPSEESTRWLAAVERVAAADVACAEPLALAAYNAGDMASARRWIERAGPDAPVADWLRAKLLLRDGEVAEAAKLLARLTARFPTAPTGTDAPPPSSLAETLRMSPGGGWPPEPAGKHLLGELGVLRLSRGDYVSALDCLLHSGYWSDAAYVAERVLTASELKAYVDSDWPTARPKIVARLKNPPDNLTEAEQIQRAAQRSLAETRSQLRGLLARRLTRINRGDEARPYFPTEMADRLDAYLEQLRLGADTTRANAPRADAWWKAAQILKTNGLALIGTEADPDWAEHGGSFEFEPARELRQASDSHRIAPASDDELARIDASAAAPDRRFHYRYRAAALAFAAAKLMPNNDDQTARVLYTAGGWLKDRDPRTADLFYKALVRRCRKTELGRVADLNRWFPRLDENGRPIERPRKPQAVEPEPADPVAPPPTDTVPKAAE